MLEEKYGLSAEVIDLRVDQPAQLRRCCVESVKKTGKLVLACDAGERGSFLHTVASNVQTLAFDDLDAPVRGRQPQLDHPGSAAASLSFSD